MDSTNDEIFTISIDEDSFDGQKSTNSRQSKKAKEEEEARAMETFSTAFSFLAIVFIISATIMIYRASNRD